MIRAALTLVLGFSIATLSTARDLEMLEGAYELVLDDIVLPGSTAGTAVLQPCADCDRVGLRVSSATRYLFNGRELPLPDFSVTIDALRDSADGAAAAVAVFYDLKTNEVTRIAVVAGSA